MHRSELPLKPCPLSWSDLKPAGRDRACDHCEKTVLVLSARTQREARRALAAADRPCVAYRTDASGRIVFRPGRVRRMAAAVLALAASISPPALAADVEIVTGSEPASPAVERGFDFGGTGEPLFNANHPRRFPDGVCGRAWLSVSGTLTSAWKKMVLRCPGMREAQPFPQTGWYRFEHLRAGATCELRLRGDGRETVEITIPSE